MKYEGFDYGNAPFRLEIAILQHPVDRDCPGIARFRIPVVMTEDYKGEKYINNYNIKNKKVAGTPAITNVTIDNTIDLPIPTEHTYFYKDKFVPAGTKFVVGFIEGRYNTARIIGIYDVNQCSRDISIEQSPLEYKVNQIYDFINANFTDLHVVGEIHDKYGSVDYSDNLAGIISAMNLQGLARDILHGSSNINNGRIENIQEE